MFLHFKYINYKFMDGSETWPIRKMDEHRFVVFERKVLRKIYGPVKDEITGEWRRKKTT